MRWMPFAGLAAMFMLSGCMTMGDPSPAQMSANDDSSCSSYGFKPETDAFANCRMQMAEMHHTDDIRRRQAIGAALTQMSEDMRANRPVTCNSMSNGMVNGGYTASYNQNTTTTCY